MAARLVFLGRLADVAGAGERAVEPGSLAEMLAAMPAELGLALTDERVRRALNGVLLGSDTTIELGEGDELAFLPPVSGG